MSTVKRRVGELRPSQMLFSFGVGAIVDLPNLSVMVMGLDDWDETRALPVGEERLLAAVRTRLGPQVSKLYLPPRPEDGEGLPANPFDDSALVGVPVTTFPRWLVCSACRLLAPLRSGSFDLKADPYRPERTRYVHGHCNTAREPSVFPARFLLACAQGHLDDFPWRFFVHRGQMECLGSLRLRETGPSGEAKDVLVSCDQCEKKRSMAEAFGDDAAKRLPLCRGRRVHLGDYDPGGCTQAPRAILMGASNSWFPAILSVLSVPVSRDPLEQLVAELWSDQLELAQSLGEVALLLKTPALRRLSRYSADEVWEAVQRRRAPEPEGAAPEDLRGPEWKLFTNPAGAPWATDFRLREEPAPRGLESYLERVVLVERLREVQALTGFTRIESPEDDADPAEELKARLVPLCRGRPLWAPATEVRGEGIFLQFSEQALQRWLQERPALTAREEELREAHRAWRRMRALDPLDAGFPGIRYVLLHSLSHALLRQLSLECGYSAASLRERLYAREPDEPGGPMAGILLYTAAPDSEGTLGGLVGLGRGEELGRHLAGALELVSVCASDPLCAEHRATPDGRAVHASACHACLFAAETSCERGNRYLDRALLVETVERTGISFFGALGQSR